ncbi:hypothetical protein [uncultured Sphingomonas sp.]|uniref:hypothetical protein n=1 Tax=uncultured Sphingomonas sp. TaxID=158754 RepID=UPI003749775E
MDFEAYARALGAAQQLVPSYEAMRFGQLRNDAIQMDNEATRAKLDDDNAFQQVMASWGPAVTAQQVYDTSRRFPGHIEQINKAYGMLAAPQKEQQLSTTSQAWSSVLNKRYDLAADLIERQQKSLEAAGMPRDVDDDEVIKDLRSGDPSRMAGVGARLGVMLAGMLGPQQFASSYKTISEAGQPRKLSPGDVLTDPATNEVVGGVPFKPEAMHLRDGDRDTIVEYAPSQPFPTLGQAAPSGGSMPPAEASAPATANAARGVRNNNPGNLEASSFAQSQPGYVGSDGRFAIFDTPANGVGAQQALLDRAYFGKGINTIAGIVAKYAPAADGNDVQSYAAYLSKRTGIPVDKPITTKTGQQLVASAMRSFESRYSDAEDATVRVVAQGAPKPGFRLMSPAEVAGIKGLDPTRAYQRSPQGRISAVAGSQRPRGGSGKGSGAGGGPRQPGTLAAVIAPILAKVSAGQQLTPGEQQAMDLYRSRGSRSGRGGGNRESGGSTSQGGGVPEGTTATGPNGKKLIRRNGQWVPLA